MDFDKIGSILIPEHHNSELVAENLAAYRHKIFDNLNNNTKRAYTRNLSAYMTFCVENDHDMYSGDLTISTNVVEAYFDSLMTTELKHHTIRHRLSTVSHFFAIMSLPNPLKQSKILSKYIALKLQSKPEYQSQAEALTIELLNQYNEKYQDDKLIALRDKAMVNLAFDGLLRGSEVINVEVAHLIKRNNMLFIPRRKTDKSGKGGFVYISDETFSLIECYIGKTGIDGGYLFRPLSPKGTSIIGQQINYKTVLRAFKNVSAIIGHEEIFTSHSGRVGKAVSMTEAGADIIELMLAGGWSKETMPAHYAKQAKLKMGIGAKLR